MLPKIVASMHTRVAVWSLSGKQDDTWHVHSSLVLPDDHAVTTLDCNAGKQARPMYSVIGHYSAIPFYSGLLSVGSQRGLSVYTLILENDLPTWSQKWMHTYVSYASHLIHVFSHNSLKESQLLPSHASVHL